jgi:hypothetical protein
MSNSVTASWVGASAYTPPDGDAITATWFGASPEMPTSALILSLVLAAAAYPGYESLPDDPLDLGLSLVAATYGMGFNPVITDPLELAFSFPPGALIERHISVDTSLLFRLWLGAEIPAYRLSPEKVLPGYSSDGTNISIPIASVIGLTAAEADAVTGDWREILQAILLRAVEYHKTWVWSDQTRTYEPFKMDLLNSRTFDRRFLIHFIVDMGEPNVAPEP